jgi:dTMP kinase
MHSSPKAVTMTEKLAETLAHLQRNSNGGGFASHRSPEMRSQLLKWYNGNPFDTQDGTLKHALKIFRWCEENSDVFEYPSEMRLARMEAGSKTLGISVNRLTDLMVSSSTLHQSARTTRLIAFEGIDDAENMRQVDLLRAYLVQQDMRVISIPYPNYQEFFGREIARLQSSYETVPRYDLDPKSLALWYALDRKTFVSQILGHRANRFVLFDRYTLSTIVYLFARSDVDLADWIFQLEHAILGIPAPDLYIVLDVPPSIAQADSGAHNRAWLGRNRASGEFLAIARRHYREISNRFPQIQFIDCTAKAEKIKTPDQIHAKVLSCLHRLQLLGGDES